MVETYANSVYSSATKLHKHLEESVKTVVKLPLAMNCMYDD